MYSPNSYSPIEHLSSLRWVISLRPYCFVYNAHRATEQTSIGENVFIKRRATNKDTDRQSHEHGRYRIADEEAPLLPPETFDAVLTYVCAEDCGNECTQVDCPIKPVEEGLVYSI